MKIGLAFSTCPNDTFIFEAIVNKRIDTEGLDFETHMADVEELNLLAVNSQVDVSKLSYHAYAHVTDRYKILDSGSALGRGNGPLFVSKHKVYPDEVADLKIAIPGKYTTAAFLVKRAYPDIQTPKVYLFSDIEEAVLSNEVDAGVLIHEGRFTYAKKGLQLITDLGKYWEESTSQPIPLGCIAVSRQLPHDVQQTMDRVLRRSIEFAIANPEAGRAFIRQHAKEMEPDVLEQHISLFVTEYTLSLGESGRDCINYFLNEAVKLGITKNMASDIFTNRN